jgi:dihydrofolate reductase
MIRFIAAIDRERGIAKCNCIPWKIPADERFFTRETKKYGGVCLIGHTTFQTFRRPLVDRQNFVLTHRETMPEGIEIVRDLDAFFAVHKEVWVVGGQSVFEQTMKWAGELYLTPIDAAFGCDRFFPEYKDQFKLVSHSPSQEENGFRFRYEVWRRKS